MRNYATKLSTHAVSTCSMCRELRRRRNALANTLKRSLVRWYCYNISAITLRVLQWLLFAAGLNRRGNDDGDGTDER